MSMISMFKAKCKHCSDEFVIATGSADECNRCASIIGLMRPLSIHEIEKLLNACLTTVATGHWKIKWVSSEGSDLEKS